MTTDTIDQRTKSSNREIDRRITALVARRHLESACGIVRVLNAADMSAEERARYGFAAEA